MRGPVPIVVTPQLSMNAAYWGLGTKAIYVASDLTQLLEPEELHAIILHERAHRELWHVEINLFLSALTVLWSIGVGVKYGWLAALVVFVALRALHAVYKIAQEAQADRWAAQVTPKLVEAFKKIRPNVRSRLHGALLDLRIRTAGTWAQKI